MSAKAANYNLYVAGTQVTDANKSNILGDGTVSYNSSTNTLTFNNATINVTDKCVKNEIAGLTIEFKGGNKLTSSDNCIDSYVLGDLILTGNGTVSLKGKRAIFHGGENLKIEGGLQLTAEGSYSAISTGEYSYEAVLTISGKDTQVKAFGTDYTFENFYNDADYQGVIFNDGLEITEPEGAYFKGSALYDQNGRVVKNQWVTIESAEHPVEAYCVFTSDSNGTLTFYYDDQKRERRKQGTAYGVAVNAPAYENGWYYDEQKRTARHIVIDESFAEFRPKSTATWFAGFTGLADIQGLEYLNTSEVTNMEAMFSDISVPLNPAYSIDLRHLNTSNVTNMAGMFSGTKLASIDQTAFDTKNVVNMSQMFASTDFYSLDLSTFDTRNVKNMAGMFMNSSDLTTIYVDDNWNTEKTSNDYTMFTGCTSLKGGKGTAYDGSNAGLSYAKVDGGADDPGYLTYNHRYKLWLADTQVTDLNRNQIIRVDGMDKYRYITAKYWPEYKILELNYLGKIESRTGIESYIDGLTIVSHQTRLVSSLRGLDIANGETTIVGDLNIEGNIGIDAYSANLNLVDADVYVRASLPCRFSFGKGNLNIDHSKLSLTCTDERNRALEAKGLTLNGSHFADITYDGQELKGENFGFDESTGYPTYNGADYSGDLIIDFDKEENKEFRMMNGDGFDANNELTYAVVCMTDYGDNSTMAANAPLTCEEENGIQYYFRASDHKLLFTVSGGIFNLAPNAEDISMNTNNLQSWQVVAQLMTRSFLNNNLYLDRWALGNRYKQWTLHFMPAAATGVKDIEDGTLNIDHSSNGIYDLQGRRVNAQWSMDNGQHSMDNGQLKKGIYIINGKKVAVK